MLDKCSGEADMIRYPPKEAVSPKAELLCCSKEDMQEMFEYLCEYSKYAYQKQLTQGFISLAGGIRVGVAGQAESAYPMFFNIRIPRQKKDCGRNVLPYLLEKRGVYRGGCAGNRGMPEDSVLLYHTLILSPPGEGKTTLLRDLIRLLSGQGVGNIAVVDERFEIGAAREGVPQNDIGFSTDVYSGYDKPTACMQAIRTMAPRVLAVDEIGGRQDAKILSYAMGCGVKILASMHASSVEDYHRICRHTPGFEELDFQRIIWIVRRWDGSRSYQVYDGEGNEICAVS